jgi:hypothetical protein
MGGRLLISFNAETRAETGRGAGDEVGRYGSTSTC